MRERIGCWRANEIENASWTDVARVAARIFIAAFWDAEWLSEVQRVTERGATGTERGEGGTGGG